MKIGVLALQGAFLEHERRLQELGAECIELRNKSHLNQSFDGIVLPGGESTVQGKLLRELEMFEPLKKMIEDEVPTLATCAGLILLADKIENDETRHFGTFPATVVRNAYGRQLGSFFAQEDFKGLGKIPMTFIRAPYIKSVSEKAQILSVVDKKIVAARFKNQLAMSFHPELNGDMKIYEYFLSF